MSVRFTVRGLAYRWQCILLPYNLPSLRPNLPHLEGETHCPTVGDCPLRVKGDVAAFVLGLRYVLR